jgi:adenylate cyclase
LIIRSARIWSGLYILAFVTSHLINLSFGVISIEWMDTMHPVLTGPWIGSVGGPVLTFALIVHFILGLYAVYERPTLRTNTQDIVQLFSGLLVVPLLATHVVGLNMGRDLGYEFDYENLNYLFWVGNPTIGLIQVLTLTVVWIHGMAGLFTWMRSSDAMRNVLPWVYPLAVAIPIIALLGYAEAGHTVIEQVRAAAAQQDNAPTQPAPEPDPEPAAEAAPQNDPIAAIKKSTNQVILWSLIVAGLVLLARELRGTIQKTRTVTLVRDDAPPVLSNSSLSMLDGLRHGNVAHAHLCAGRGRCGTCAVQIVSTEFPLPEISALEARTLLSVGAPEGARLACQCKPTGGHVRVNPLYPADFSFTDKDQEEDSPPTPPVSDAKGASA